MNNLYNTTILIITILSFIISIPSLFFNYKSSVNSDYERIKELYLKYVVINELDYNNTISCKCYIDTIYNSYQKFLLRGKSLKYYKYIKKWSNIIKEFQNLWNDSVLDLEALNYKDNDEDVFSSIIIRKLFEYTNNFIDIIHPSNNTTIIEEHFRGVEKEIIIIRNSIDNHRKYRKKLYKNTKDTPNEQTN